MYWPRVADYACLRRAKRKPGRPPGVPVFPNIGTDVGPCLKSGCNIPLPVMEPGACHRAVNVIPCGHRYDHRGAAGPSSTQRLA